MMIKKIIQKFLYLKLISTLFMVGCVQTTLSTNSQLISAVKSGDFERVESAISNGADVNLKNPDQYSILHLAIRENHCLIGFHLIEKGANVNDPAWGTYFPLDDAITNKNIECVTMLLSNGANSNETGEENEMYFSPFRNALSKEKYNANIVGKLIESGGDCKSKLRLGENKTILENVIFENNILALEQLLKSGCAPNYFGHKGWTPLQFAVVFENVDAVRVLLNYGANPKLNSEEGYTTIEYAAAVKNNLIGEIIKSAGSK